MNENSEANSSQAATEPEPSAEPRQSRRREKHPFPTTIRFKFYWTFLSMALGLLAFHLQYDHNPDAFHDLFEYPVGAFFSIIAGLIVGVLVALLISEIFWASKRGGQIAVGVWVVLVIALLSWCDWPVDPIQREIRWLDYPGSVFYITLSSEYGPRYRKHCASLVQLGDTAVPALTKVLETSQNPNACKEAARILAEINNKPGKGGS